MSKELSIKDIEEKRAGLELVLAYCIDRYEQETNMNIEEIRFKEDGSIFVLDRLNQI
jgi:hypothetical protein